MVTIKRTPSFDHWLNSLDDKVTVIRLKKRLEKVSRGVFGDIKAVGDGVFEMREFFGAGYRMYYVQKGDVIIVMLGGGDKASQASDIAKAIALSKQLED